MNVLLSVTARLSIVPPDTFDTAQLSIVSPDTFDTAQLSIEVVR